MEISIDPDATPEVQAKQIAAGLEEIAAGLRSRKFYVDPGDVAMKGMTFRQAEMRGVAGNPNYLLHHLDLTFTQPEIDG